MSHAFWHGRRGAWVAAAITSALLVGLWAIIAFEIRAERRKAEQAAAQRVMLQAQTEEKVTELFLQGITTYFAMAEDWALRLVPGGEGRAWLEERMTAVARARRFAILQIGIIGPDGRLRWSTTETPDGPVDLSDREHFRVHVEQDRGLFVSAPLVGRVTGQWSLQFSRRLNGADGSFAGVLVLSVDPFQLGRVYDDLGAARVGLWRNDGVLVTRDNLTEAMLRQRIVPERRLEGRGPRSFRAPSLFEGEDRFVAQRRLADAPLYIAVSSPATLELAGFRGDRRFLLGWGMAGSLLLAGGAALLWLLRGKAQARQAAEEAARIAAGQQRLLDGLPIAVQLVRPSSVQGRRDVVYANAGYRELHRLTLAPDDVFVPLEPPMDIAELTAVYRKAVEQGEMRFERQLRMADGTLRWGSWTVRPVDDEEGTPLALVTMMDTEAEKAATASAMAASRLATLGELSAGLAHELSQPLTVIALMADTAALLASRAGSGMDHGIQERMATIGAMVSRARTITQHLRRFARQDPVERVPVRLADAMEGARLLTGHALADAGIALEADVPAHLPEVWASRVLLEQVLMNLLLNARDAMLATVQEERRLSVSMHEEGDDVVVTVADSGPGIPAALLHSIFEPFVTTKNASQGTGLGLSICHGIMASFGGSIVAANGPACGAAFTLRLKAVRPQGHGGVPAGPNMPVDAASAGG